MNNFYGEDFYQGDGHALFLALEGVSIDIE